MTPRFWGLWTEHEGGGVEKPPVRDQVILMDTGLTFTGPLVCVLQGVYRTKAQATRARRRMRKDWYAWVDERLEEASLIGRIAALERKIKWQVSRAGVGGSWRRAGELDAERFELVIKLEKLRGDG